MWGLLISCFASRPSFSLHASRHLSAIAHAHVCLKRLVNAPEGLIPIRSHPAYLLLVHVLLQAFVQVLPPFKQQRMADEFEPRGKLEGSIVEHQLQSIGSHVSSIADFVQIRLKINVGFDEENIID
jgi:hypothetical protein